MNKSIILYAKITFIILFTLYFIVTDKNIKTCKSFLGKTIFIIHHLFAPLILFSGILFGFYYFNIFIILLTLSSWFIFGKCLISIYHNKLCKFNKNLKLNNVSYVLRKYLSKKLKKDIHWKWDILILVVILLYNFYMEKNDIIQKMKLLIH